MYFLWISTAPSSHNILRIEVWKLRDVGASSPFDMACDRKGPSNPVYLDDSQLPKRRMYALQCVFPSQLASVFECISVLAVLLFHSSSLCVLSISSAFVSSAPLNNDMPLNRFRSSIQST